MQPGAGGADIFTGMILPFAAMAAIMYFLLIRPQQKQRKKHQEMLDAIKKGDMVITNGGVIGKVTRVDEREVKLNLGDSEVRVLRSMIMDLYDQAAANTNDKK